MKRLLLLSLAIVACDRDGGPAERYGFVTVLGRDTVAVERITRSPRRLVTDGVDKWPLVRQRHSEFELDKDGRIQTMVMDVRTPSGKTPAARGRRVTADFSNDVVRISVRDSAGVRDTSFNTGGAITVPHVSMMYSVIELEVAAALRRMDAGTARAADTASLRQFYPDRDVGPAFALHHGVVRAVADRKVELRHDWLSGVGDITVDSAGRLMTYSGKRSTYQVTVTRTAEPPDVESIGDRMVEAERRTGASQLSVRDTARASIGDATLSVDYGRPLARGRTLIGDVIPYDYVWRTGANAATQFTTSKAISLAGVELPAGTYTLWTVPRTDRVDLVVNSQTGQWGTSYDRSKDIGRAQLETRTLQDTVEKFTIAIEPLDSRRGTLSLAWGTFRWTAPIVVK